MISRDVVFHDRYGLHPRAARRIQASLDGITATVSLMNLDGGDATIDARGMLALISSGIRTGDRIRVNGSTGTVDVLENAAGSKVAAPAIMGIGS